MSELTNENLVPATSHGRMQARMSSDDSRLYDPGRDVAHCFGNAVQAVAARLEDKPWSDLHDLLPAMTLDELGDACRVFVEFVTTSVDHPKEDLHTALKRVGFLDLKPEVQIVFMTYLGQVMTGMFFDGVRMATVGKRGPLDSYDSMYAAGARTSALLSRPRNLTSWMRRIAFAVRGFWRALRI